MAAQSGWSRYEAKRVTASTEKECQWACVINFDCTGFDWESSGGCWMHGPWNAHEEFHSQSGVVHYDVLCDRKTVLS